MPSTIHEIRQELIPSIPSAFLGTAGSSDTTALNDTDDEQTLFTGDGGTDFTGYWLVRPGAAVAGDSVRRISFHDRNQGLIKPSRAWTNAPTSETYELWPPEFRPTDVDRAINLGLTQLRRLVEEEVDLTTGVNVYDLDYDWLTAERQVLEVYWEYTNSGMTHREEYPWFKVFRNDDQFALHLYPIPSTATGNTVIIEGKAYYEEISGVTTTDCPLEWIAAKALVVLLENKQDGGQGLDVTRWSLQAASARKELFRMTKKYAPRRGRRMMPRTPMSGTSKSVRRGEFYY